MVGIGQFMCFGQRSRGAVKKNVENPIKLSNNTDNFTHLILHEFRLSSGQWSKISETTNLCTNHDDGVTAAIIQCETCQSLCADCDRFLHLSRKTRNHRRTVCKEEEDAIRVELHEGCGRTKLFWLLALADSRTLKAIIEFRDGNIAQLSGPSMSTGKYFLCKFV